MFFLSILNNDKDNNFIVEHFERFKDNISIFVVRVNVVVIVVDCFEY